MKTAYFDLEANGLLDTVTKVHCIALAVGLNGPVLYTSESDPGFKNALAVLDECDEIVGHNIIGYDLIVLWKLHRWKPKARVRDSMILSQLVFSDNLMGHSMEDWGGVLGITKVGTDITDWSAYTENMGLRCVSDVRITRDLFYKIEVEMRGHDWSRSIDIEHQFAKDFAVQTMRGVAVDWEHATRLKQHIEETMAALGAEVEPELPPKAANKGQLAALTPPSVQFKKDGTPSANLLKWFDKVERACGAPGTEWRWFGVKDGIEVELPSHEPIATHVNMTLVDQQELKTWLMECGWVPTMWNYKKEPDKRGKMRVVKDGNGEPIRTYPKMHDKGALCPNLEELIDNGTIAPIAKQAVKWIIYRHRLGIVKSCFDHRRDDGRVSATGVALGTPTARVRHVAPVCNIPTAEKQVILGAELRGLFIAPEGRVLVGADAAGLELRQLADRMNDADFTRSVLEGDKDKGTDAISLMWKLIEEYAATRKIGKPTFYGWLYGASDRKTGETAGHAGTRAKDVGKAIRAIWLNRFPALKELLERLEKEAEKGYITGLDGRRIPIRSKHAILNTDLQSGGSICVKHASNWTEQHIRVWGVQAARVIHYHDEGVWECADRQAAEHTAGAFRDGLLDATDIFKLKCPLDSDFKIGRSWAEIH